MPEPQTKLRKNVDTTLLEDEQRAAFKDYKRTGKISIKSARERKSQTAPSPPQPTAVEKAIPPAEPVRERDEQTPSVAQCNPSAVPLSEIGCNEGPGWKMPERSPQGTQEAPEMSEMGKDTASKEIAVEPTQTRKSRPMQNTGLGVCPYCGKPFDAARKIDAFVDAQRRRKKEGTA